MTQPISKPMDWATIEKLIAQRGRCDIAAAKLNAQMAAKLHTVRESYARRLEAITQVTERIDAVVEEFAAAHRTEMTATEAGGSSWRCLFGKIAFRKLPPRVEFTRKIEAVLVALKAARLTSCIRSKEEPNKEALLALDAATLKRVHVKKVGGDQFELVPDLEAIANTRRSR